MRAENRRKRQIQFFLPPFFCQCQRLADQRMRDRVVDSIVMARQSVAEQNFWWKMRLWRAAIPDWAGGFGLQAPSDGALSNFEIKGFRKRTHFSPASRASS